MTFPFYLTKTGTIASWRTLELRAKANATFSAPQMCDIKPFHPSGSGLDPRFPLTLDPESYAAAARLRLGAGFTCQPITCRLCNRTLDINGTHALCCAPGEGTRGHNEVRDVIVDVTEQADATAKR